MAAAVNCLEIEAMWKIPLEQREMGAVTLNIKDSDFAKLRDEIRKFKEKLLVTFDRTDGSAERVYQFNLQLFPTSKASKAKT